MLNTKRMMMRPQDSMRRAMGALLVLGACIVGGCQSDSSLPSGSGSVRVAEGERNATVRMTGILHVELVGNSGTGFEWQVSAYDPSLFEPIGKPHITPLDAGVMGGRTITTFQFRPLRVGKSTLVFEYVRPAGWNEPAGKKVQVEATVEQ